MTASQRPERVDRAALVEAAAHAIFREEGPGCIDHDGADALAQLTGCYRNTCQT